MILLAARLAVNTNANILDDVDPTTEHPQITDYTHPIDPWGSAMLGVDNGKVCFWGATDLSFANSSAREYCGRVYGYTGPTLIAAQAGVFLPGGADENAGLDARRRRIRMPQTTRPASTDSVHPHASVHQHALCLARRAVACRPPASRHSIAAPVPHPQFRRCRYFTHDAEATLLALEKPGPIHIELQYTCRARIPLHGPAHNLLHESPYS